MKIRLSVPILLICSLLFLNFNSGRVSASTDTPSIDFTVTPAQAEIVKPASGNAEGALNINLIPKGKATNADRSPMDVIFIFDKSASMSDPSYGGSAAKYQSAKDAMKVAINYFKQNAGPKDNFAFIPFSTNVDTGKIVYFSPTNVNAGLDLIQTTVNGLKAEGATNYVQSFTKALELLQNSPNKKKNIIFMTDGAPTYAIIKNKVTGKDMTYYAINSKNYSPTSSTYSNVVSAIRNEGIAKANLLADLDINLYSIGFGNDQDVDNEYLRNLSSITGAFARRASEGNISDVFREISSNIDTPTISGEAKIDLSKFNGKVNVIEGSGARVDSNGIATFRYNVSYPVNAGTPPNIDLSLPLSFSAQGSYSFDNIKLTYTDLSGKVVTVPHSPVTITVKDDAPPSFKGTMDLVGVVNTPDNLIKYTENSNAKTDAFKVNYTLTPQGLINNLVTGSLTNITLIQPLPDGITLTPTTGASLITLPDGRKAAQIALPNVIYTLGRFNPTQLTTTLNLKAEWAISNTRLPIASVSFKDSRFGVQTTTITPSNAVINMKVRLLEFVNKAYDGDSSGILSKLDLTDNRLIAQSEFPNNYGLSNKAIKDLNFLANSQNRTIEVTYLDNSKAYINLTPDFVINGVDSSRQYNSGDTSEEDVKFKLSNIVAGKDVKYKYSLDNGVNWKLFTPTDSIPLTTLGLNKIIVKAEGGFAVGESSKEITIVRKIKSVSVNPNPIEIETGKSVNFTIDIQPSNAGNKELDISIKDTTKAGISDSSILGIAEGTTSLVLKTKDGSNLVVEIPIKVIDPYVALKEIKFNNTVYTLEIGDVVSLNDYIIFNPSNATYKTIDLVESTLANKVEVFKENGVWKLKASDTGYSTITIQTTDPRVKTLLTDSALFNVTKKNDANVEDDSSSTNGKW